MGNTVLGDPTQKSHYDSLFKIERIMMYKPKFNDRARQAAAGRSATTGPTAKKGGRTMPIDAADLSRRLLLVQAEQKSAQAERKRKDKAAQKEKHAAEHTDSRRGPLKENAGQPQPQAPPQQTTSTKMNDQPAPRRASNESSKSTKERPMQASTSENEPLTANTSGPYVPREAASQFRRTATPLGMIEGPLTHRLSRQALKASFERKSNQGQPPQLPSLDGLRRSLSQRDSRIMDRAHARPPKIIEEEAEESGEPLVTSGGAKTQLRFVLKDEPTGIAGASKGSAGWKGHRKRPSSTGDLADRMERHELHQQLLNRQSLLVIEPVDERVLEGQQEADEDIIDPEFADEHRVDWTQSDEKEHECEEDKNDDSHLTQGGPSSGLAKRRKSIWGLRMKFGQQGKQDDLVSGIEQETPPEMPLSPKSPKARFFSRFKH